MKVGDIFQGRVTGLKPYGAFIQLNEGLVGLIHISEIKTGYVTNIHETLTVGQEVTVQVIDIDDYSKKVSFSMRSLEPASPHHQTYRRFSKQHYKIGFKPLGDQLSDWIEEGLDYLKKGFRAM